MVGSGTPMDPRAVPGRPKSRLDLWCRFVSSLAENPADVLASQGSLSPCLLQYAQSFRLPPAPSQWPRRECSPGLQALWRWWRGECGATIWL